MGRPTTKQDLLEAANTNYEKLMAFIDSMTQEELSTPFNFEGEASKKEAHWKRDKSLREFAIALLLFPIFCDISSCVRLKSLIRYSPFLSDQ